MLSRLLSRGLGLGRGLVLTVTLKPLIPLVVVVVSCRRVLILSDVSGCGKGQSRCCRVEEVGQTLQGSKGKGSNRFLAAGAG